jgi:hypothetical protein
VLVLGAVAAAPVADAQTNRWKSVPLEQALLEFADASGVDLVFAHRLVRGRRVSGAWTLGEDPARGLADLLEGTRLRAERIRARQYVIIAEPINVVVEPGDPAAYTGVLEGHVLDADTGRPLEGAHVLLVDLRLGGIVGPDGGFSISALPAGQYTVQFSYVGYRSVRLRMDVYPETSLLPPTIRLRPEPFTLAGAVVRPRSEPAPGAGATDLLSGLSPSARQAAALPASVSAGDLWQVLDWLPGVTRAAGGGAGLVVRGFDPSLVRTYRDGAPVIEPAGPSGISGLFQREALRAIRFHRGTAPVELGGGVGGALEVEPEDGRGRASSTGVAAAGPLAARFVVTGSAGARAGFSVAARHSLPSLGYPVDPIASATVGALIVDPIGGLGRSEASSLRADYRYYDAEATMTFAFTDRQRTSAGGWLAGDRLGVDGPSSADGHRTTGVFSARHRALIGETFLAATAYGSRYGAGESVVDSTGRTREYDVELVELGARLDADQYVSFDHTLRAGLSVARRTLDAALVAQNDFSEADRAETEGALWLMDTWRPLEGWQVETGIRADAFGARRYLSPRVLARWTVVPERVYARAGGGRQLEGLLRLPDPGPAAPARLSARWLLAGRDAPPVSVWQAGAGVETSPLLGLALSADVFLRSAHDLPEPRAGAFGAGDVISPDSARTVYVPAHGRAFGFELAARAEGGPWLLAATYTLSGSAVRLPGDPDDEPWGEWQRARHDRPHVFGLLLHREARNWHAGARLDVMSTPPESPESVFRLELTAGYRFSAAGAVWTLQAQAQPTAANRRLMVADGVPPASMGPAALAFVSDGATMPAWPIISVRANW